MIRKSRRAPGSIPGYGKNVNSREFFFAIFGWFHEQNISFWVCLMSKETYLSSVLLSEHPTPHQSLLPLLSRNFQRPPRGVAIRRFSQRRQSSLLSNLRRQHPSENTLYRIQTHAKHKCTIPNPMTSSKPHRLLSNSLPIFTCSFAYHGCSRDLLLRFSIKVFFTSFLEL
jgi:hypothetical protein